MINCQMHLAKEKTREEGYRQCGTTLYSRVSQVRRGSGGSVGMRRLSILPLVPSRFHPLATWMACFGGDDGRSTRSNRPPFTMEVSRCRKSFVTTSPQPS